MAYAGENAATAEQLNYTNPLSSKSDQADDRLGADMVTRGLLIKMSKRIASDWQEIARRLDVPEERIKAIACDSNFGNLERKAFVMLHEWQEKNYKKATEAKLCLALLSEEMTATASDLFGEKLVEALKSSKKDVSEPTDLQRLDDDYGTGSTFSQPQEQQIQRNGSDLNTASFWSRKEEMRASFSSKKLAGGTDGREKQEPVIRGSANMASQKEDSPARRVSAPSSSSTRDGFLDGNLERENSSCSVHSVGEEFKLVDDQLLLNLAKEIVSCWQHLAIRLNLEGSDIDAIKLNGDGVRDQAFIMLKTWKEQAYEKATDFNLCKTLLEEKRQDIALKFFRKDFVATVREAAKSAQAKGPPQLSSEIERGDMEESLPPQSSSRTFGSKSRGKRLLNVSLPLLPESFCGRDDVIRDVIRCIEEDKMPLCWLWGPPGCGTSTVGIAVLHRIRGRQGLRAVAVKASRFSFLQLQELIRSHSRQHCTFLVDGYDDNLERREREFLMAIEDLVQELGKEFTVLVTSHKKPLCSIGALRVESIEVNWLGEEDATELLTWHYTGGKKDRISDDSIPKYLKRLALRCDGIPFVLKAVGSAGYAACHSRSDPVRMERSISNSRRVLRLDNALFERFCSNFDAEGEGLEPCFKMCYERLPEELKPFILGLAIISGSFSAEFGGKILGLGQRESDRIMIRLKDRGFITSCQRKRGQGYRIPRYLQQYLMAESQSSTEQCVAAARARYFEKIRDVITRISKRLRDKRQGDALKTFTDHRSRILGFLQLPSSILDLKAHDVTMAICTSAYVKNVLLDYVLVDTLRLFCETSLDRIAAKSDSKSKQDKAYIVIFLAQIVLKQQRYRQGDLKKIDGMLQAVLKEGTLPKEILLQRKIAQAEILMAKGEHFNAVDLLAESKKKKVNSSALAILGKASYQLGIRNTADSQSEEEFWKIARPHFEEARECFTNCIENLAKNDSLTCLYTMWIGDCCFLMREYREALRVYEELLKEEDSVNWPNMGSDFVSRKRTRVSATYYALGLSHLQLHVRAGGWDSKDLAFCLASLEASIQGLAAGFPYSCFLSDVVYLAKGIVILLLALNEQWKETSSKEPNVEDDVYLSKAVKSFTAISCRNSVLTNERKALLDVANAYKEGRAVSPETKRVSKSARILLDLTPSSEKSKVKLLFAKSLLYLDIVEKDRNQRLVSHEKALSYEKAFDSDLDASDSEDDDDDDEDDDDDDDDGDGVPNSSYEHQTAYAASRFDRRKLMKGFVNCFLPSWTNETIQSQFDGTGLGETQTLASELITSSVEWADRSYFGHIGRSCPARANISSGNFSSPDFTTRNSAKTGPPMIDHS